MQAFNRQFVRHNNGQTTSYIYDTFADPWRPTETVLIQHGFGRTAEHFYHWVPALARRYNVLRRDLRGHGGSSYPRAGDEYNFSTATIVDEIKDTLDQLGIDKVHFIGESTSGMLAEIFAATYPERVRSVVVCSSPTHLPQAAQDFLAFGMESWPEACLKLGSRGWAERLSTAGGTLARGDEAYVKWWVDRVAMSSGEGLAGYARFLGKLDSREWLTRIQCPMLILCPTGSALVTVESMEEVAAAVPRAKLELIESAGHEIYSEAAEACIESVLKFWESLELDKAA